MTTPNIEELRKLAEAAKPWRNVNVVKVTEDDGSASAVIGAELDGEFYPCVDVDCDQYYAESHPFADWLAAINEHGSALLDALQSQAERIKQDKSHIEMLERAAEEFMRDRDTLRAKLADLQVDDELPEPAVGFDYDYYEGLIRYEAPVPRYCDTSYYTADQLRQAQAAVRAKMVPLEKDAARYRKLRDNDFTKLYCDWVDELLSSQETTGPEDFDAAIDAAMGITGEPK